MWSKEDSVQEAQSTVTQKDWPTTGQVQVTANDLPQPHRDLQDDKTSMGTPVA
jgi:hypothetical protein